MDFELEVACIIGAHGRALTAEEAERAIFGYTIMNDWSARDVQRAEMAMRLGPAKSKDFATSLGPCIVTKDEIPDPNKLNLRTTLNGNVMQDHTTSDMIFDVPALIESLSSTLTLRPGSILLTGTPHGVGFARTPPVWMKDGDTVAIEIENIGSLENPVRSEA